MPTYEYACKQCGDHLEIVQSFKDDALTDCPSCDGELKKVFGNIGIVFKGNGFYITDYRSESYKQAAKKESSSVGSSGSGTTPAGGGDSKTTSKAAESKPAPAPAAKS